MQLGIHVGVLARPTFEQKIDAAKSHGLECLHLNLEAAGLTAPPEKTDSLAWSRLGEAIRCRGLAVASLSATFNMIHPDLKRREAGFRRLEWLASAAAMLGTRVLTLCSGTRDPDDMWRFHPDNQTPAAWNDLITGMATALARTARSGVTLAVEPEPGNVVASAAAASRLLDEMRSARLGIIIDPANLISKDNLRRQGEVIESAFDLLGEDVVLAHAKDVDRQGVAGRLPPGRGLLDYHLYLKKLKDFGFAGPLILHALREADVPGSVRFLREILKELG